MARIVGSFSSGEEKKKKKGPGVGSKLLYGLSLWERPAQALKVGVKEALDEDDEGFLEGMRQGWLGEDEVRGQDILFNDEYAKNHPILAGVGGFLFDVATDPLTYFGPAIARTVGKGVKAGYGTLPKGARGAVEEQVTELGKKKVVQDVARGLNVPYGAAKKVKIQSMQALNRLQGRKNETDKLIKEYQKWAKAKTKDLGLKTQDDVDRAFRDWIEAPEGTVAKKKGFDVLGEEGREIAERHMTEYRRMLRMEKDAGIRVGTLGTQADWINPVDEYLMHVATPAARKAHGPEISEFLTSKGAFKERAHKGTIEEINERMFTQMGEQNMFHTNPAIIMGVRSQMSERALQASRFRKSIISGEQKWFGEEIMDPRRGMGLWFRKDAKGEWEVSRGRGQAWHEADDAGKQRSLGEWRKATDDEVKNYASTDLDSFKGVDELIDDAGNAIPGSGKAKEFMISDRNAAKMVKERHALMVGKKANEFFKYYDEIQNGWKRWTLGVRPAYHTRNMVGNYLNAWMISGLTNPARYVDAGVMQRNAYKGTLDDVNKFKGKGSNDELPWTEKELHDEMNRRGAFGGLFQEDIQRGVEEGMEAAVGTVGSLAKRTAKGDVLPVRKAFEWGSHIENNPRVAVFIDTLLKARKNPSKYKWYDAETGEIMNLNKARGAIKRRHVGTASRYIKMEKELRTGVREYPGRGGKVVKRPLNPEQLEKIAHNKRQIEKALERDWTSKISATSDAKLTMPKMIDKSTGAEVTDVQKILSALAKRDGDRAIFDVASMEMKKSLFDYRDLSKFEQDVLKRGVPFYTWSRKNIPAQLESLIKNPQRAEKLHIAREQFEHQGGSPDDRDVGPMWSGTVPIFLGQEKEGIRSFFSLLNYAPIADLERVGHPNEILKQMVSPIIKEPLEQVFNYDLFRNRKIKEFKGQSKDFLGVALPPGAWHAAQLLVPLVELNRLNPGNVFGLQQANELRGDMEITPGWWGLGASRESNPVDIPGLARTIRFFAGVRRYDLDLQKSREWNKKKFVRDLTTLKARLKWAKKKNQRRKAEELEMLIEQILNGEETNPLMTQ